MASIEPKALESLRLVTVEDPDSLDLSIFPDFFFAGPQRTGSTWLYDVLRRHPEIFLTQPKEIYYFNTLRNPNHPQRVSTDLAWYLEHYHESRGARARRQKECRKAFRRDFAPKVYGEATASYAAALDEDCISDIVNLNPDLKVVITIRHPVERIWSHAKWDLVRCRPGRKVADVEHQEFVDFFAHWYNLECGLFTRHIAFWSKHLKPGNVFVGLFDDVVTRPIELAVDVMKFLGVEADPRFAKPFVDHNPNPTPRTSSVPEPYRSHLDELYREEIERLRAEYGVPW